MNYKHFSIEERCCIRFLLSKTCSIREIARELGRNPSSVSREIRRNITNDDSGYGYYPSHAQRRYKVRKHYCHKGGNVSREVKEYIEEKLKLTWSPEQIAKAQCEYKIPSFKTIYRWIYLGILVNGDTNYLRKKGKFGNSETRGKFNMGTSIRKRDKSVYKRKEVGHWEADTVVSGRGKAKDCFVTLAERKTRYYIAYKVPNREAKTVANAIIDSLGKLPQEMIKTITCDRGKEFAEWEEIENKLKCKMYFADPYCAWQKGTNENSNGLLREFFPKGMNLRNVTQKNLNKKLELINGRPRKINNYISATQLFNEELSKCCT